MYFDKNDLTSLDSLAADSNIHVIGVCGVAMAQLAIELSKQGFRVSGSDKEYYEPMGSALKSSAVVCKLGYFAHNIPDSCDLVVIGNAVSRDNPEVQEVLAREIKYTIFPKLLCDLLIDQKLSIVVSGTHGKTTTTAMLAYVLECLGEKPSYFFGGKAQQLADGLQVQQGKVSVVEGDEYDSAFFIKSAKFHFYKPEILIVNAIEFDHADIYADLEQIMREFEKMIEAMPEHACIIGSFDDAGVRQLFSRIKHKQFKLISYGEHPDSQIKINFCSAVDQTIAVEFEDLNKVKRQLSLVLPGKFNLKNALACFLALQASGLNYSPEWLSIFRSFQGVARRQQVWLEKPIKLIEDFAHHPTAVAQTIEALKQWNPKRRLIAVFEPRSATSRRNIFENDYVNALALADVVILKKVELRALDKQEDLLNVQNICDAIQNKFRRQAIACDSAEQIEKKLQELVLAEDLVVVMSNGSFEGLILNLKQQFALGLTQNVINNSKSI